MFVYEALGFQRGEMVALIGAGGKTTTLFRLAKELRDRELKVLVTTTTKIYKPTKPHVDRLFLVADVKAFLAETARIPAPVVIGGGYAVDDDGKLVGLPSSWFETLQRSKQFDAILIEADGAASRLFKVPSEIEPVVPALCSLAVWIMAIKILGKPLEATWVHRSERAIALLDTAPGSTMTEESVLQLVQHPAGCFKGIPPTCRRVALLNQADSTEEIDKARSLGTNLLRLGVERVVITSYLDNVPVKEVMNGLSKVEQGI
jgi:probable selenium-dependent hydroxylase accessory protein YqeC